MTRLRTAVLISGRGSNMRALVEAARDPNFPAEIVCVLSNRPDAKGLEFARANGIAAQFVDHKLFHSRSAFEAELAARLEQAKAEAIACAGFMRILSPDFVSRWDGRMINIHPSLLPAYKGLHTHERVLADGGKTHGCTVHFVTPELDAGPILLQAEVPVRDGDTPEILAARVLAEEHRIYPTALAMLAQRLQAKTSI